MTANKLAANKAAEWWAVRLKQGDKKKFTEILSSKIEDKLDREKVCQLNCDYDPWDILLEAVQEIGLNCTGNFFSANGILPRKHILIVYSDRLEPKEGYGNWTETIKIG